jgi:hypothetical protein
VVLRNRMDDQMLLLRLPVVQMIRIRECFCSILLDLDGRFLTFRYLSLGSSFLDIQ